MASERRGPFDRILKTDDDGAPQGPDRAFVYVGGTIVGLALLLLILVMPPISILSRGDGDGGSGLQSGPGIADRYTSKIHSGIPKLPAGLVAASALFDLSAPEDQRGASAVTVPLKEKQADARNLALYTYIENRWQRLADAQLVAGGTAARGEVNALPGNVVVLRRNRATLQVAGSLAAGNTLSAGAESSLTTLHPIVFIPADSGEIAGQPPAVPPANYEVVPSIVAPSAEVVDNIMRSTDVRARHAAAIAEAVTQGNFAGINVDYRNVNSSLREQYTAFVQQLAEALHQDGRELTLTLPMPVVVGSEVDTGGYDWEALGAAADTIEMTGEPDQELYFQRTEAALEYVTEQVDRSKILLTVESLSYERGGDGLRPMSLEGALSLASLVAVKTEDAILPSTQVPLVAQNLDATEGASGLRWDETARSVTFDYPGRGGKRTVWIANQFSAAFRLELAQRYGLAGITVPDVSTESGGADVWAPIKELADTGSLTLSKPNGDLFAPVWSATAGTLSPTSGSALTWTAPAEPGTYDITIVVSDGVVRSGQQIALEVVPPPDAAPATEE
jgi:hypothetical protein